VLCKRAALLFAMHRDAEVAAYFARHNPDGNPIFRAVAALTPVFEHGACQAPVEYGLGIALLAELWGGESVLGHDARTTTCPDGSCATLVTANADDPPPDGSTATKI
jgi:hypothetical protein